MNLVDNLTLEEIDQRIAKTTVEAAIEIGYYLKQIRDRKRVRKESGAGMSERKEQMVRA